MKQTYQQLKRQLDAIMLRLQDEELDIDEALELYKTGQKVIAELEAYLAKAKLHITKTNIE